MAIPNGVILIWTGTNASIPTGWERVTDLDDKYPKAWGTSVAPNNTGGSDTHTHSGAHTHTLSAHAHTCTLAKAGDYSGAATDETQRLCAAHGHLSASTTNTTSGGSLQSTGTWASSNNEPPYYKVIFIKPSGVVGVIQTGICSHFYGSSAPIGWNFCNGSNSTPDLRNKYLKGASTGADAGTTGGGTAHSHTVTHNHTANAHSHTGQSTGVTNEHGNRRGQDSSTNCASIWHTHTIYLDNSTDTVGNYTKTDAGSGDTVEVAYKKLGVIQNASGGVKKGMVALWLGATNAIPKNWVLCDGNNDTHDLRDKFIKIGADLTENNATGGSNTHTHSAISHTHSASGTHTHTGSTSAANDGYNPGGAASQGVISYWHTHTVGNISSSTSSFSTDNMTADTVDNQPAYRTVAYIQLNKLGGGASFLLNFI